MIKWKRNLGIALCILGMGLIALSNYVQIQVEEGKIKISAAQHKVNKSQGLFSLNPMTKQIGHVVLTGAQKKINEGREEVNRYELIAGRVQLGGVVLIISGIILFVLAKRKRF